MINKELSIFIVSHSFFGSYLSFFSGFFKKTVSANLAKKLASMAQEEESPAAPSGLKKWFQGASSGLFRETLPTFQRNFGEGLSAPLLLSSRSGEESSPAVSSPDAMISARTNTSSFSSNMTIGEISGLSPRGERGGAGEILLSLLCMICMAALCNFDHGAIPAVLQDIQGDFSMMGYIEQSLLGSLVYVGVVSGTFLAGVFTHCSKRLKWPLIASLFAASASLYGFSCANSLGVMYATRFFVGFFQVS